MGLCKWKHCQYRYYPNPWACFLVFNLRRSNDRVLCGISLRLIFHSCDPRWKKIVNVETIMLRDKQSDTRCWLKKIITWCLFIWEHAEPAGDANRGFISKQAPLLSSKLTYLKCLACAAVSPESHTKVKWRFDAIAAWSWLHDSGEFPKTCLQTQKS